MSPAAKAARVGVLLILVGTLSGTGCAPKTPRYVDERASYTRASVVSVLDRVDVAPMASRSTGEAEGLRHDALAQLRSRGGSAASVAQVLTSTFPASTRGVPLYVERADVDGKPAILMVEAIGPEGGRLATKRLWVLDETGAVVFVATK